MPQVTIRDATPAEDETIAYHFYQLWLDNDVSPEAIHPKWLTTTLQFIAQSRRDLQFQSFVAESEQQIIGSASCQRFAGLYPSPFQPTYRAYGYIWNVYVEATHRRQGIAAQLMQRSIAYLKSLGCTRAILHASPSGKPLYTKLGFTESNEMRLDLS